MTDSYKKLICRRVQVRTDELNDMTPKCLLRVKHQVQIRLPKQTAENCIVVVLNIHSANIADYIIDADKYYEAFVYFVDEVERIMEVLDDEASPIEEVCVKLEEEEKWNKLKIVRKKATRICIQGHE